MGGSNFMSAVMDFDGCDEKVTLNGSEQQLHKNTNDH